MNESTILHSEKKLYVAFELGNKSWHLAFSDGQRQRQKVVTARSTKEVSQEIARAKAKFGLPPETPVVSCYEAGRDGFWLHRFLILAGIGNIVVDSASILVDRRVRRTKTDRLDATALLDMLIRFARGETRVWRVVRVPDETVEDERRLHRERERLVKEQGQHRTRLRALLTTQGVSIRGSVRPARVTDVRDWRGQPLPAQLQSELLRECQRLEIVEQQVAELDRQILEAQRSGQGPIAQQSRKLVELRSLGPISARTLSSEVFGWRKYRNGKEVGASAGLTGSPYNSGSSVREQGISKAGNRRVRATMVELAWSWLRYQPESGLSAWYRSRFGVGQRARRIGIVALARRLLVALWRYLEHGIVPAGAVLRSA